MRLVVLALLIGCTKPVGQPESKPPPKATAQQCEQVADHLVGLMLKNLERDDAVNETADAIRRVIDERCVQDGWSPYAHDCFTKLQSMGEVAGGEGAGAEKKQPCEEFLSVEQRENIDRAMQKIFE